MASWGKTIWMKLIFHYSPEILYFQIKKENLWKYLAFLIIKSHFSSVEGSIQVPWFFKTVQKILYSTRPSYYLQGFYGVQLSCTVWCFKVYFEASWSKFLINGNRVTNLINSLDHRCNVACSSLFYRYHKGRSSREIWGLVADSHVFLFSTRTSRSAHPFVVDCTLNRTMPYRKNLFLPALLACRIIFLRKFFPSILLLSTFL